MNALQLKQLAVALAIAEHADISGKRYQVSQLPASQHEEFVKEYRTAKQAAGAKASTTDVRVSEFRLVWRYISSNPKEAAEFKTYGKLLKAAQTWNKAFSLDVEGSPSKSYERTRDKIAELAQSFGPMAAVQFCAVILKGQKFEDQTQAKRLTDVMELLSKITTAEGKADASQFIKMAA